MQLKTLLIFAAIACSMIQPAFSQDALRPVASELIGNGPETARDYIGTVSARIEVDLGFPVSGTIASRPVSLGDTVQKGDILAQLDPEAFEAGVWAARAGVVIATQELKSAQDALERERILVARGVESRTRLEDAQRRFAASKARLEQAQAARIRAEDILGSAILRAPQNGIVTRVLAEPGASVSAGQPVIRLAATNEREVVIDLTESELAILPQDVIFDANLIAVSEVNAQIRLRSVNPVADTRTRTRRGHFTLLDAPKEFRIGALVRAKPKTVNINEMTIPLGAVLHEGGYTYVWVISRPDGVVHKTAIILGKELGDRSIVTSGLQIDQEVLIKGIHSIKDGQIVGPRVE